MGFRRERQPNGNGEWGIVLIQNSKLKTLHSPLIIAQTNGELILLGNSNYHLLPQLIPVAVVNR